MEKRKEIGGKGARLPTVPVFSHPRPPKERNCQSQYFQMDMTSFGRGGRRCLFSLSRFDQRGRKRPDAGGRYVADRGKIYGESLAGLHVFYCLRQEVLQFMGDLKFEVIPIGRALRPPHPSGHNFRAGFLTQKASSAAAMSMDTGFWPWRMVHVIRKFLCPDIG
jgi:hypothetical protein